MRTNLAIVKTVLYFQTAYRDPNRKRAEGVREYAAKAGWRLQTIPYGIHAVQPENDLSANVRTVRQMSALIAKFAPDGCLVEDSPSWDVFDAAVRDLSTVYVDRRRSRQGKGPAVFCDNESVARAAFRELTRSRPLVACAFIGSQQPTWWSQERQRYFLRCAKDAGLPSFVHRQSPQRGKKNLVTWLKDLPLPCGIFAANDPVARGVAEAALSAGLSVPDDVLLIGADNDEAICEIRPTTLTSVRIDHRQGGFVAAEMLDELMDAGRRPGDRTFGAAGVVRRATTRCMRNPDALVADWLETIRLTACGGLTADSLAEQSGLDLRTLERRFLRATGQTVGAAIRQVRLDTAERLLSSSDLDIAAIAASCGYRSESTLRKLFHRIHGTNARSWRQGK